MVINPGQSSAGIGANFLVKWGAEESVKEPNIDAIMTGAHGTQGFAWRNPGYVVNKMQK